MDATRSTTPELARRGHGRRATHGLVSRSLSLLVVGVLAVVVTACVLRDPLEFSPTTLPDGQVGTSYSVTVAVSHAATPVGGVSVQAGSLPPGMDVFLSEDHDSTFQIAGVPQASGTYTFSIYVWCYGTNVAGQTATQPFTLVVK